MPVKSIYFSGRNFYFEFFEDERSVYFVWKLNFNTDAPGRGDFNPF